MYIKTALVTFLLGFSIHSMAECARVANPSGGGQCQAAEGMKFECLKNTVLYVPTGTPYCSSGAIANDGSIQFDDGIRYDCSPQGTWTPDNSGSFSPPKGLPTPGVFWKCS